jgi:hypothetical protein
MDTQRAVRPYVGCASEGGWLRVRKEATSGTGAGNAWGEESGL